MKKAKFKRWVPLYLMMAPGLIYLFINNYMPMAGLVVAFKNYNVVDGIFGSFWCNKTKEIASYFTRAGMLFLIFQIQNSYDQKPCIQDNHKFFICTHKPHSFLQDSETEWYHILPVAWVSILYCQGVAAV